VHFDGGANDLTGGPGRIREERVHYRGLMFEQKETKQTRKINHSSSVVNRSLAPRIISRAQRGELASAYPKIKLR
jgi:hypothetical protein